MIVEFCFYFLSAFSRAVSFYLAIRMCFYFRIFSVCLCYINYFFEGRKFANRDFNFSLPRTV